MTVGLADVSSRLGLSGAREAEEHIRNMVGPWTIYSKVFSFRTHNSSQEGATKLKFAPFCSS